MDGDGEQVDAGFVEIPTIFAKQNDFFNFNNTFCQPITTAVGQVFSKTL